MRCMRKRESLEESHSSKSDKKGKNKPGRQKLPKPPKGKSGGKKHFHSLEARDQSEDNPQTSVFGLLSFGMTFQKV